MAFLLKTVDLRQVWHLQGVTANWAVDSTRSAGVVEARVRLVAHCSQEKRDGSGEQLKLVGN